MLRKRRREDDGEMGIVKVNKRRSEIAGGVETALAINPQERFKFRKAVVKKLLSRLRNAKLSRSWWFTDPFWLVVG